MGDRKLAITEQTAVAAVKYFQDAAKPERKWKVLGFIGKDQPVWSIEVLAETERTAKAKAKQKAAERGWTSANRLLAFDEGVVLIQR